MSHTINPGGGEVVVVEPSEIDRRIIEPKDFVADTSAFVDVRLEGSVGKASYSFIGPGVSQNADQTVNLSEPHGFCVGGASMPSGAINNQHMHYTAEVFICTKGHFEMRLGQDGSQRVDIGPNSIFSIPTWMFRGFQNVGADDSWLFAVLGGDDTGGLLWAPQVLEAAAETGLVLTHDHAVVDTKNGEAIENPLQPVNLERLSELDSYTDEEIGERIVSVDQLEWSRSALLSSVVAGHGSAMAPVIGFGMTEDRRQRPQIWTPHGFTLEWLQIDPGASTGPHRIAESQALILVDGDWQISYNRGDDRVSRAAGERTVVSVPAGSWRDFTNTGDSVARCLVVCASDERAHIEWDPSLVADAAASGWGRDASGYRAPLDLIGTTS